MTNPMTSYYESNLGYVNIDTVNPPRTLLSFGSDRVSIAYNHSKRTLVMSCPNVNGCWAFSGLWSWWPMESSVNGDPVSGAPIVSTTSNLVEPWVLATTEDIFCVSGSMYDEIPDASFSFVGGSTPNAYPGATTTPVASPSKGYNFVISKLGYGGALDRSSYQEDFRSGGNKYIPVITPDSSFANGAFYFERPVEEEDATTGQLYYWLPVELVPPVNAGGLTGYELLFRFDNTEWDAEPSGTSVINVRFPTERLGSTPGLSTYNTATSGAVASPTGDYIHLVFNGSLVANTWTTWPALSVNQKNKNPLIYIRFKKKTANSVMGMGIIPTRSIVSFGGVPLVPIVGALVWTSQSIGAANSHNNDAKAQCIDWAYKSNEVSEGSGQIKARGIYAVMNSQGRGLSANRLVPGWLWGIYNVILGSDSKEYTSQVVDYDDNLQKIVNKGTIRSRFRNLAGDMKTRTFSGDPKWGSQGGNIYGDYLIDDQQTDDIATSDSVKGQRISYMVFGFIQDKAEALSIRNLTGVFRRAGTRRRTGR